MPDCEFCGEFCQPSGSRFAALYTDLISTRIIEKAKGVAVIPTLGQLFPGSLLILPVDHFETLALTPQYLRRLCLDVAVRYSDKVRFYGRPILFEHGALCRTERSCGIYHAHLHLVPLPAEMSVTDLLPNDAERTDTLGNAFDQLEHEDTYLVVQDTKGGVAYLSGPGAQAERFQSQYFRRLLKSRFEVAASWDWREYTRPEPFLIETVRALRAPNVALCN